MPTDNHDGVVRETEATAASGAESAESEKSLGQLAAEVMAMSGSQMPETRPEHGLPRPERGEQQDAPRAAEKLPIGAPMQAWVKGGTHTAASERMFHERFADAEVRRDAAAKDKALASIPIEHGGGRMFTHNFSENPEVPKAYVKLQYANRYGAPCPPGECLADIVIESWDKPNDLTLIFVCPGCYTERHKSAGDCQLKMRMSNRWWKLLPFYGETKWTDPDGQVRIYKLAGTIVESEPFSCPDCGYRGRIVNGWLRQE
jgi:predicted RNA-binding Zn-ribbon protein involved in translation (DUF1610 family)